MRPASCPWWRIDTIIASGVPGHEAPLTVRLVAQSAFKVHVLASAILVYALLCVFFATLRASIVPAFEF